MPECGLTALITEETMISTEPRIKQKAQTKELLWPFPTEFRGRFFFHRQSDSPVTSELSFVNDASHVFNGRNNSFTILYCF